MHESSLEEQKQSCIVLYTDYSVAWSFNELLKINFLEYIVNKLEFFLL
jgi:hypothetical protein